MVCMRVAFHENDANHEDDENEEDNSDSYKDGRPIGGTASLESFTAEFSASAPVVYKNPPPIGPEI